MKRVYTDQGCTQIHRNLKVEPNSKVAASSVWPFKINYFQTKNLFVLMLALLPLTSITSAQEKQLASPHETIKAKNISVTYGRPYKKGREIFGALVPYGKVWRAGADEATEVTF